MGEHTSMPRTAPVPSRRPKPPATLDELRDSASCADGEIPDALPRATTTVS